MTRLDSAARSETVARLVEENYARLILEHDGVPGSEVHHDPDAVWQTGDGGAWSNAAIRLRFAERDVARRLDRIIARVRSLQRPLGFWVTPWSTPSALPALLRRRGFRCRKHFPGMHCELRQGLRRAAPVHGLRFERLHDHARFLREPHPYHGRITTPLGRTKLRRDQALQDRAPDRVINVIASLDDTVVAAAQLYLDGDSAGLWNVGVLDTHRNRGIGAAITAHACEVALDHGYRDAVLISSGMGFKVYGALGFDDVCRMSYWYSRLGRDDA